MNEPAPFPVVLKLEGRPCLVVGSGSEATARTRALLDAGALVRVVSEAPDEELLALATRLGPHLRLEQRGFEPRDLDLVWLAVLTDQNDELAAAIAAEAERRAVFFCAVDQPFYGTFAHVARARAGSLTVAISTGGKAPALARRLREVFQALFDEAKMESYVERLARLRARTPSADRARVLGAAVKELRVEGRLVVPSGDGFEP